MLVKLGFVCDSVIFMVWLTTAVQQQLKAHTHSFIHSFITHVTSPRVRYVQSCLVPYTCLKTYALWNGGEGGAGLLDPGCEMLTVSLSGCGFCVALSAC